MAARMDAQGDDGGHKYGARLLLPISHFVGLPVEKVAYVTWQLFGLCCGYGLRTFLCPSLTSSSKRHVFNAVIGAAIIQFCFGSDSTCLVIMASGVYILLKLVPQLQAHIFVFSFTFAYLIYVHYWIMQNGKKNSHEIAGPLMLMTQRAIALAFGLRDGIVKKKDDEDNQQNHSIFRCPSLIEYVGYLFNFQTVMSGPFVFYDDYIAFIEGKFHVNSSVSVPIPTPPMRLVLRKVLIAACYAVVMILGTSWFPVSRVVEPDFIATYGLLTRVTYSYISVTAFRLKYYYAWTMAEAICNTSGLGYSGDNRWDGASNGNFWKTEASLSARETVAEWNTSTVTWLRFVAHDRLPPSWAVFATMLLSAAWHGLWPGYYCAFLTAGSSVVVARMVRRTIRPLFLSSPSLHRLYHVITFMATRFIMGYGGMPFCLLDGDSTLRFYKSFYFIGHILLLSATLPLYCISSRKNTKEPNGRKPEKDSKKTS